MFVVIPLKDNEKLPKYNEWQNITETDYDSLYGATNTGNLCGKVGKITVLDVDIKNGKQEVAELFMKKWNLFEMSNYIVKTTSGGFHFYFNYSDQLVKSHPLIDGVKFLDVMTETSKNTSSYVVGAGSIVNKKMYTVIKNNKIGNMDENLLSYLKEITEKKVIKKMRPITNTFEQATKLLIDDSEKEKIKICLTSEPIKSMSYDYFGWSEITGILKKYDLFQEWILFSAQWPKFNLANEIKKWNEESSINCDIHRLSYLYNTVHFDKIHFTCKLFNKLTEIPEDTIMINSKYITEVKEINKVMNEEKCIIIKSHMNSGKTTLIREFVQNNDYNLISVCPLISLVDDQYNNSNKITNKKFNHYKNTKKGQNIFTTIDSLSKLEIDDHKNIFLYLDEISSLLYYIQNVQYSNSNVMLNSLINVCKMATKIICTDADVNDCVLNFFNMIGIDYKFIYNSYQCPIIGKNYICSQDTILKKIKDDIEDGNYVFITSDRKETTKMMYMFLRTLGVNQKDIILINADETEKNKELYNTALWHNKHIIISPSVTNGVDFPPEKARNVYCIIKGGSINPITICQQIFRCRKIIDIYTYIEPERALPMMHSIKYVTNIFSNIKPLEIYENALNEDVFNYIQTYYIYADDLLKSAYRPHIYMYLYEKGFNNYELKDDSEGDDLEEIKDVSNELAMTEMIQEAEIIIEKYMSKEIQKMPDINNPIIKRLNILNIPRSKINDYKEIVFKEAKFSTHLINCLYIDMLETPNKIKNKFILKNDYQNKLFKTSIGKVELLRRIHYGEDAEINKQAISKIQRIKSIEKDNKQFIFRVLKSMGCDMLQNNAKYAKDKAIYSVIDDLYDYHKELRQFRLAPSESFIDTAPIDDDYNCSQ